MSTPDQSTAQEPSATAPRRSSIGTALTWTGLGKYAGQVVRWGATLVAARLLMPSDYGLVGMTGLLAGLVTILAEFGVGTAALRMRHLEGEQLERLNGFALLTAFAAAALVLLLAKPMAMFFQQPKLSAVIASSSISFVLAAAQTVPMALLQREHRFKLLAYIEFASLAVGALAVLAGALIGLGYWALVLAPILSNLVSAISLAYAAPVKIRMPHPKEIKEAVKFSAFVFLARLGGYLLFTADFFVVGRVLGEGPLGSYQFAWSLSNTPNDQVNGMVARVSGSFYSSLQHDRARVGVLYLSLVEAVSIVSVPLALGLAVVAPEFIQVVLGSQWLEATRPLQVLCVFNAIRVSGILAAPALSMLGEVRYLSALSLLGLLYIPAIFLVVAPRFGTTGVSLAWAVAYPPIMFLMLRRLSNLLSLPLRPMISATVPAFVGSAFMCTAVFIIRDQLVLVTIPAIRLAVLVVSGAMVYLGILLTVYPDRLKSALTFLRKKDW